jgi:hypothetical protein
MRAFLGLNGPLFARGDLNAQAPNVRSFFLLLSIIHLRSLMIAVLEGLFFHVYL